ncbi:hypothetical protein ACFL1G_03285 [Planctomycetota bacterium]
MASIGIEKGPATGASGVDSSHAVSEIGPWKTKCGHKLPTGYPEGRRIWINVKFYDDTNSLISESGAYDPNTGVLSHDSQAKIYDIEPGIDPNLAAILGVSSGPSLHFVLNNTVYKDNRIPPRGFTNAAYADFGGAPIDYSYPDGQYWDDTYYSIPLAATSTEVILYYQSTSKEFVEFLRDENVTNNDGNDVYDLWNNNDKCPPEVMETAEISLTLQTDFNGSDGVDFVDFAIFATYWGIDCTTESCGPANLDGIGGVDAADLAIFAESWLWGK